MKGGEKMLSILATFPLLASIVTYFWGSIFNDESETVLNTNHKFLIACQIVVVSLFYLTSFSVYSTFLLAGLYVSQAIGILVLLKKKGNASCGCFGSQINSTLSVKLSMFNLLLAIISLLGVYYSSINFSINVFQGAFLLISLALVSLVVVIGIPDAIYAIQAYKERNLSNSSYYNRGGK